MSMLVSNTNTLPGRAQQPATTSLTICKRAARMACAGRDCLLLRAGSNSASRRTAEVLGARLHQTGSSLSSRWVGAAAVPRRNGYLRP